MLSQVTFRRVEPSSQKHLSGFNCTHVSNATEIMNEILVTLRGKKNKQKNKKNIVASLRALVNTLWLAGLAYGTKNSSGEVPAQAGARLFEPLSPGWVSEPELPPKQKHLRCYLGPVA